MKASSGRPALGEFVYMSTGIILALGSALLAIAYGIVSIGWIMKKPEGSEEMRSISGAIQEGASAYFKRQYTAIGIVGAVLFVILFIHLMW